MLDKECQVQERALGLKQVPGNATSAAAGGETLVKRCLADACLKSQNCWCLSALEVHFQG